MSTVELNQIERELGIELPQSYRSIMGDYPFEGPDYANCQLEVNGENVVAMNQGFRNGEFGSAEWPPSRFTFGHDGAGNHFFLDLSTNDETVYCIDHETHQITTEGDDIHQWAREWLRELEEYDSANVRHSKPWWKLW